MKAVGAAPSVGRITWMATAANQAATTKAAHSVRRAERVGASESRAVMAGSWGLPSHLGFWPPE